MPTNDEVRSVEYENCRQVGNIIYCQCGKPSSHYGTMGVRGAREVREEKQPAGVVPSVQCPGCGKVIDPDVCGCGDSIASGIAHDNHYPIPAGCDCFRDRSNFLVRDEP